MSISLDNRVLLSPIAKTSFGKDIEFLKENEKQEDINWENVYKESVKQTVVLCLCFIYCQILFESIKG